LSINVKIPLALEMTLRKYSDPGLPEVEDMRKKQAGLRDKEV